MEFSLGAKLSLYDPRTYPAKAVIPATDYPQDYESPDLGVSNQLWVGRCVSESISSCVEEFLFAELGQIMRVNRDMFYQNRLPEQWQGSGMYPSEACDNVRKFGIVLESVLPGVFREYTPEAKKEFTYLVLGNAYLQHAITTCRIANIEELKNAMSKSKTSCFIVIPAYQSFMDYKRGLCPMPNEQTEKLHGYHAMKMADYHSSDKIIVPKNSWGIWGEGGKVNLPESYPISEMWAITDYTPVYDVLEIFIDSKERYFNGEKTLIDVAPYIKDGRTCTPTRHTHEPFGDVVKFDSILRKVTIMRAKVPKE